ncbi:uncharacterized protein KQ657_001998 [Scheffersomyces spartinae]|uniref:RRM domain-containing protein n=1 Tax=Scheffersomyces spartinae TaxID=45513 RepID=A0A9P7V6H7_9ASCO|nr:uncharacterized protein KQ657_001998 [Scheffersomyces spartinae]KAG7192279.1 hypothetical protein KQ657_001998 [Scheffersomyces spartinae]
MSQFASFSQDNTDKYPEEVQRLFKPRPPILHRKPLDLPAHLRKTHSITPLSQWKSEIEKYIEKDTLDKSQKRPKGPRDTFLENHQTSQYNLRKSTCLRVRQLQEWENATPESLARYKDPHRTVFVLRLDYRLQELDLLKHLNRFGDIESVTIIRDKKGNSRGYGFVVFENEADSHNCIKELAPTGLRIPMLESESDARTILVDMERGRLVRNWKPRRLGGGLGGRHYTRQSTSTLRNPHASAAAARTYERHGGSQNSFGNRRSHPQQRQQATTVSAVFAAAAAAAAGPISEIATSQPEVPVSIRDKYAQYVSATVSLQPNDKKECSTYKYQRTSLSVRNDLQLKFGDKKDNNN